MSQYQSNSVCFNFPETWEVVDDDGDNFIRAITIEDPNDGFYSMDIYNTEQAPTLEDYIERSMKHFTKELPFYCKIIEEPIREIEKSEHQNTELEGVQLTFTVRSFYFTKIAYVNSYFRVQSGNKISLISSQYPVENATEAKAGFSKILNSFSIV
ncbi:MAG: hypothetical protein ACI88A_004667 [Paraglaciecola sp.]|jgi:hypothetical protein